MDFSCVGSIGIFLDNCEIYLTKDGEKYWRKTGNSGGVVVWCIFAFCDIWSLFSHCYYRINFWSEFISLWRSIPTKIIMKKRKTKIQDKFNSSLYLKTYIVGLGLSFFLIPFFAYAATTYSQDLFGLFEYAKDIIDELVLWTITTLAVLFFVYKIIRLLMQGQSDPKSRAEAFKFIVYGLIALTLMFTFYAVSGLLAVTFGIQIGIPQFFGGDQTALTPGSGNVEKSYSVIGN